MNIARFLKDLMTDKEIIFFILVDRSSVTLFTQRHVLWAVMKTHCPKVWKFMAYLIELVVLIWVIHFLIGDNWFVVLINNKAKVKTDIFKMIWDVSRQKKNLASGNHLLAEICIQAQVFSSQDAESGVLEIPVTFCFWNEVKNRGNRTASLGN